MGDHFTGSWNPTTRQREASREGEPFDDSNLRRNHTHTVFDYDLPGGRLLYQQNRYDPVDQLADIADKKFLPSRPVNLELYDRERNIGASVIGPGERRIIFNWQAVIDAGPGSTVLVTEGEKNAVDLNKAGILATTVISNDWTDECAAALTGYDVIILEDHDEDGRKLSARAKAAISKHARSVRIVPLDHLWRHLDTNDLPPENGDVSDWLFYGGDPAKLLDICREIPADGLVEASEYEFPDPTKLEPWNFLYGKHLLRETVSGTAAMGGTGKSSLAIVEALAMATGKELLGEKVPGPLRVLLINLEDNRKAMDKRIAAAMKHHGLTPEDVGGRLRVIAKGEMKLKMARLARGVVELNEATIKGLITFARRHEIDVISIDPFVKTHGVPENSNSDISDVIEAFDDIAEAADCAVHLWHQTKKMGGTAATVESLRGAMAFIDACRSIRILETMTKEEGKKHKIEQPRVYFRAFNGKLNFAPPSDQSDWYQIVSVDVGNGFPFGDEIGVVSTWEHPGAAEAEDLGLEQVEEIKRAIDGGEYKSHVLADNWAGKPIGQVLGMDPDDDREAIKKMMKKLIAQGVLREVQRRDPKKRDHKMYIEINRPE